jgi:hypothetical protein
VPVPAPAPAHTPLPPGPAPRSRFPGLRSDPYAAFVELLVACPLLAYGAFELSEAIRTTKFVLNDPRTFLHSDARIILERQGFAAVHYLPALVLLVLALFVRRRDQYMRPLSAALFVLALGAAHINAVLSIFAYGAWVAPFGILAIALALRPNSLGGVVPTIFATLLFPYAAIRMDGALRHVLLGYARQTPTAIDTREMAQAVLAWLVGSALVGAALAWRREPPGRATQLRLVVISAWGLPLCAGTYALLHRLGLPLAA